MNLLFNLRVMVLLCHSGSLNSVYSQVRWFAAQREIHPFIIHIQCQSQGGFSHRASSPGIANLSCGHDWSSKIAFRKKPCLPQQSDCSTLFLLFDCHQIADIHRLSFAILPHSTVRQVKFSLSKPATSLFRSFNVSPHRQQSLTSSVLILAGTYLRARTL
jgi:hypothetical protein